jgi:outer membrane protein assembly factor BamB
MRFDQVRRAAIVCCLAVLGAVTLSLLPGITVAHASPSRSSPARWVRPLPGGPWGVSADDRGAVVVADDGSVVAVSPAGRTRWIAHAVDVAEANPAIDDARVLVGGAAGVTALDRGDGAVRWHADLPGEVLAVTLAGDVALTGSESGALTAFAAATGAPIWSVTRAGALWSAPRVDAASGSVVATWHGGDAPRVEVFDLASGAPRWSAATASRAAAPTLAGRGSDTVVVVAAGDGQFTAAAEARDLATGAVRWRVPVPASFERAIEPAAGRHEVVLVDHFGTVTVLDLADGHTRWQRGLGEPVLATRVSLTRSRVVLTTYAGTVTVLGRADGRVVAAPSRTLIGGYPVGGLTVAWGGTPGFLTGLRLSNGGLALLRVP